jgi:DNA-binding transcriptional LysR family regulator
MAELRAGLAEVATWQGKAAGRIIVGAMPLSRARWLPEAISRFAREYPGVGLMVVEGSHGELSGPLRDGEIDLMLGALREGAEAEGLAGEEVFADTPVLVMRKGHPLEDGPSRGEIGRVSVDLPVRRRRCAVIGRRCCAILAPSRRAWRSNAVR